MIMAKKKETKKKETKKKVKKEEPKITDILEEYFFEGDQEMVKRTYMNGNKKVKEEIVPNN